MTIYTGVETKSTIKPTETVLSHVGAIKTINAYLAASSYTAKGPCNRPKGTTALYGVKELKYGKSDTWSQIGEAAQDGKQYYYCFAKYPTGKSEREAYDSIYYRVELFYRFEIPILREFLPIRVDGVTDEIYLPASDGFSRNTTDYFTAIGG